MTATINGVAGEEAMHTVLELVPYQRVAQTVGIRRPLPQSDVMAQMAKDYGFENVVRFGRGERLRTTSS
jgi:hypothetical protein